MTDERWRGATDVMREEDRGSAATLVALVIGSIGVLIFGLQPILLGELQTAGRVTLEGVGLVAMAEIVTVSLGVVAGDLWLQRVNLRHIVLACSCLAAACDAAGAFVFGDLPHAAIRAVAGLAEGGLTWVAVSHVIRTPSPSRMSGRFLTLQVLMQAAMALAFALAVIPALGWKASFFAFAAVALVPVALCAKLPVILSPLHERGDGRMRWSLQAAWALGIAVFQLAAILAVWAYLEPLGAQLGLSAPFIQILIFVALLVQALAAHLASQWVHALGSRTVLAGGSIAIVAICAGWILLGPAADASFIKPLFAALACALGFCWLFLMPFQMKLAMSIDPSGKLGGLIPAAQILGCAIGPLCASFAVTGSDAGGVLRVAIGWALGAAVAIACARPPRGSIRTTPGALRG